MSEPPVPTSWEAYARALGVELQRRRMAYGLTQEDLAHKAGMTRTHYQQLERGWWTPGSPSNPSIKALIAIALALELAPADLLPSADGLTLPLS